MSADPVVDNLRQDCARMGLVRGRSGFTSLGVLTLALGIGATAFRVEAVLLPAAGREDRHNLERLKASPDVAFV